MELIEESKPELELSHQSSRNIDADEFDSRVKEPEGVRSEVNHTSSRKLNLNKNETPQQASVEEEAMKADTVPIERLSIQGFLESIAQFEQDPEMQGTNAFAYSGN